MRGRQAAQRKAAKKNVTIAVSVAQFTFSGCCFARKRLRALRSKSGLSVRDAVPGHGHTNCSPERPKQNFLPTLTS